MANMTVVQAAFKGTVLTGTAATAGPDKVVPGDGGANVYVICQNGSGAPITVNVADPNTSKYQASLPAVTSPSIAAGGFAVFGPIQADLAQPSDALAWFTPSASASVTWRAFRG